MAPLGAICSAWISEVFTNEAFPGVRCVEVQHARAVLDQGPKSHATRQQEHTASMLEEEMSTKPHSRK